MIAALFCVFLLTNPDPAAAGSTFAFLRQAVSSALSYQPLFAANSDLGSHLLHHPYLPQDLIPGAPGVYVSNPAIALPSSTPTLRSKLSSVSSSTPTSRSKLSSVSSSTPTSRSTSVSSGATSASSNKMRVQYADNWDSKEYHDHQESDENPNNPGAYSSNGQGQDDTPRGPEQRDPDNDETICPKPVLPVFPVNNVTHWGTPFSLWGSKPYSAFGTFYYVTNRAAMPVKMYVDPIGERVVVDHVTTYHWCNATHCFICLKLTATVTRCFFTPGFNFKNWEAFYNATMVTDGALSDIYIGNNIGKVQLAFGRTRDQHSTKFISATVKKIVTGRHKNKIGFWGFYFEFPCSTQAFEWSFDCFEDGMPDEAVFAIPSFVQQPISRLPNYATFVGNFGCAQVPPPA